MSFGSARTSNRCGHYRVHVPSTQQAITFALAALAPALPIGCLFALTGTSDLPQAAHVRAAPTIAAVFTSGLAEDHTCSASVITSKTHDLLITAAHCISGDGSGVSVAPGYDAGKTPYGVWPVTAVFVNPAWESDHAPPDDIAILRVAESDTETGSRKLQDVTGSNPLGATPAASTTVTVQGFNLGIDDHAISCASGLGVLRGNPTFRCDGYVGGSSGSPWLVTGADGVTRVTGVIGGLNEGGCTNQTSFSPVFDTNVQGLLARAEHSGIEGDTLPTAGPAPLCSTDSESPTD